MSLRSSSCLLPVLFALALAGCPSGVLGVQPPLESETITSTEPQGVLQ